MCEMSEVPRKLVKLFSLGSSHGLECQIAQWIPKWTDEEIDSSFHECLAEEFDRQGQLLGDHWYAEFGGKLGISVLFRNGDDHTDCHGPGSARHERFEDLSVI